MLISSLPTPPPIPGCGTPFLNERTPHWDVGWAQLLPPETWAGPWEGLGRMFRIMSALPDQTKVMSDSAAVMRAAWRAPPSSTQGKSPLPEPASATAWTRAPRSGPCHCQAGVAKAVFKGKAAGAGRVPDRPHRGLRAGPEVPLREEPADPRTGPKSPPRLGAPCLGSLALGNAQAVKGWS